MALTKLFNFIGLSALLCMPLTSCDSSSEPGSISFEAVGVLSVEASANFDLSDRSDWKMYVGKIPYSFEVSGTQLSATPSNGNDYVFEFTETNRNAVITLVAPNYDGSSRSDLQVPSFKDQSTPDKFMRCDMLKAEYRGEATAALKEINFFHQNALLAFRTIDLPEEARVFIEQTTYNQTITPLQDSEDPTFYKAIVLPQMEMDYIYIIIELNGKRYEKALPESALTRENMPSRPQGIGASALVEFDVRINQLDRLTIENFKRTAYTKEWPIDR